MKLFNVEIDKYNIFVKMKVNFIGIKVSFKIVSCSYIKFIITYSKYLKRIANRECSAGVEQNRNLININSQIGELNDKQNLVKHLSERKENCTTRLDNITKRLFITSGNLSLINTLACINQFNLTKDSENSILIWSHAASKEFDEVNEKISRFIDLKYFFKFYNRNLIDLYNFFLSNSYVDFDEIYFPNCRYMFDIANILFPNLKYNITEEGVCVLIKHSGIDYTNVEKYIFAKYLDKMDIVCANEEDKQKLIPLDKKEFLKISNECEKVYPLNIELDPEDKNVIFCATIASLGIWSLKEILNYQNEIIDNLIEKGYKVFFKPHPRDTFEYKENDRFRILNTKLPLECYSLKDKCLAVVSLFSSAVCQMYYYQGIAGFCSSKLIKECNDFGLHIINEYSPPVEMLLSVDVNKMSFKEAQKEILEKYENWINKKPLLSQNEYLKNKYENLNIQSYIPKNICKKSCYKCNILSMLMCKKIINFWDIMNYRLREKE